MELKIWPNFKQGAYNQTRSTALHCKIWLPWSMRYRDRRGKFPRRSRRLVDRDNLTASIDKVPRSMRGIPLADSCTLPRGFRQPKFTNSTLSVVCCVRECVPSWVLAVGRGEGGGCQNLRVCRGRQNIGWHNAAKRVKLYAPFQTTRRRYEI